MNVLLIDSVMITFGAYGILSVGKILQEKGYTVKVIGDAKDLKTLLEKNILPEIIRSFAPDVVGLSMYSQMADYITPAVRMVKKIKKVPVIIGGQHPSLFPEQTLRDNPEVDYVFSGPAEDYFPIFLEKLISNECIDVPGVAYLKNEKYITNGRAHLTKSLGSYPIVDHDILDSYSLRLIDDYDRFPLPLPHRYILGSRGCPYKCSFCYSKNLHRRLSYRSPEHVVKELIMWKERGVQSYTFIDDNFTLNKEYADKICDLIIKNKLNISWEAQIRVDLCNPELIDKMKRAGCLIVIVAVEHYNDRIRNDILNKNTTKEQIDKTIDICKKAGFFIRMTLMVGSPTETIDELKEGIAFLGRTSPDYAGIVQTTILPGTPLYEKYKDQMEIESWEDFDIGLISENAKKKKLTFHYIPEKYLSNAIAENRKIYSDDRRILNSKSLFVHHNRRKLMLRRWWSLIKRLRRSLCRRKLISELRTTITSISHP
jgi:radical SAM superfamily enzyme YgiQ (UPF0313 family)